jgi:cob(I)alamin adenosyltransferase
MILLFTGNGKGKTTASLGQMVRVLGREKSALMIQFIKGPWISGEDAFAAKYHIPPDRFQIRKMGLGFVGILGDPLPIEKHKEAAALALEAFMDEKNSGKWHLIVLDEINVALSLGLLAVADVVVAVKDYPDDRILILTGRGAPQELIDIADLATEMREIKHPFAKGGAARPTVEF